MSGEPLETENVGREERQRGEDEPRRIDIANATINWIVSHLRLGHASARPSVGTSCATLIDVHIGLWRYSD